MYGCLSVCGDASFLLLLFFFFFFFFGGGGYFVVFGVQNCFIFYIIMYNVCFLSLFNVIIMLPCNISVTLITVYLLFKKIYIFVQ